MKEDMKHFYRAIPCTTKTVRNKQVLASQKKCLEHTGYLFHTDPGENS